MDLLLECGFNKPLSKIHLCDKVTIIQTVTLHKVILASLAELSQFRDGFSSLGVLKTVKEYSHFLHSFYCSDYDDELNSGTCIGLILHCHKLLKSRS